MTNNNKKRQAVAVRTQAEANSVRLRWRVEDVETFFNGLKKALGRKFAAVNEDFAELERKLEARPLITAVKVTNEARDGDPGEPGKPGADGWTPMVAVEQDGDRTVQKVVDYFGGTGPKPPTGYVGPNGLVDTPDEATDIGGERGPKGKPGEPGKKGKDGLHGVGMRGPRGLPGAGTGGDAGYDFTQSTPATTWTIAHNLGRRPAVQTFSVGGVEIEGQVIHLSDNTLQIDYNAAVAGTARLV